MKKHKLVDLVYKQASLKEGRVGKTQILTQNLYIFLVQAKNKNSGKRILQVYYQIANELIQIVKQISKRSTLKQGKKKLSQDDRGGCC